MGREVEALEAAYAEALAQQKQQQAATHLQQVRERTMQRVVGRLLHSSMQCAFQQWAAWAHMTGVRAELTAAQDAIQAC